MSKNKITPTKNYTNNNMLKNISNIDRIYNVRNNKYENDVTKIIDKCIVNYDSKKKIVIQNIISNSLNKLKLTQKDVSINEYIIDGIMNSPDIDVLKISTIYFIIDKLFIYKQNNDLRQLLIDSLNKYSNKDKNIKQYLSIYLKTSGSKNNNNINIKKLEKCKYIKEKEGDSLIFEIVAFTKVNNKEFILLYGKSKFNKSLLEVKSLKKIEDNFKNYNISPNSGSIEKFDINKALKDKRVNGVEIKAPIRKFAEKVGNKMIDMYYIYNKNTNKEYKLYNDINFKDNYDRKECDNKETSSIVKISENSTESVSSSSSNSSLNEIKKNPSILKKSNSSSSFRVTPNDLEKAKLKKQFQ